MGTNLDDEGTSRAHGELKSLACRTSRSPLLPWGGRVVRCTHGWSLPCLLSYCSAGPWVAAAAPPHSLLSCFFFLAGWWRRVASGLAGSGGLPVLLTRLGHHKKKEKKYIYIYIYLFFLYIYIYIY